MFDQKSSYTLRLDKNDEVTRYYISFENAEGETVETEVDEAVANTVCTTFVRWGRNLTRWDERHLEQSELTEGTLHKRAADQPASLEEAVEDTLRKKRLYQTIELLPEVQRRRLLLYFFEELTFEQIARMEKCRYQSVQDSIKLGIEKLKKIFSE